MPPRRRPQANVPPPQQKAPRQSKLAKENAITATEESEIKEAFSLFSQLSVEIDAKESIIPTSSIRRALTALGTPPSSTSELQEILETVDPDGSGEVGYEHFVAIAALKLKSRSDESKREEVAKAFDLFTGRSGGGGEGKITLGALKRVARELKEDVNEQVLKDMIQEANGGGGIHKGVELEEFEEVMRRAGAFT